MLPRNPYYPEVSGDLRELLRAESLELFGVADTARAVSKDARLPSPEVAEAEYSRWIAERYHGTMDYLDRHAPVKYDPGRMLSGCRSVVVVGMNYYQARTSPGADAGTGRVARYAWGRDYHNALGKRLRRVVRKLRSLYPSDSFRSFVDASPLSERFFAERAAIGFTAKNTLTVTGAYGSWFLLGEILSTVEFPPTPAASSVHGACPSGCFRCGDICPTDALFDAHRIDARRCISYLTIEHKGSIPEELRPLMGDWIFGCDLCQETCPLNLNAGETRIGDFTAHRAGESISLREILDMKDETAYRARFTGTPLLRPGRVSMIRNALIAAANTSAVGLLPRIRALCRDRDPVIREHAMWTASQFPNV